MAGKGGAGTDGFHTANPATDTAPTLGVDDHMAQLPGSPTPAQHLPPFHHSATDAGADGQHHHIGAAFRGTMRRLPQKRHGGIILDGDQQTGGGCHGGGKIAARQIDIAAGQNLAAFGVDLPRNTDAQRLDLWCHHPGHQRQTAFGDHLRIGRAVRPGARLDHTTPHPRRPQTGAADVDADGGDGHAIPGNAARSPPVFHAGAELQWVPAAVS